MQPGRGRADRRRRAGGAHRARRGLRGLRLAGQRADAGRGRERQGGDAAGRPADVCRQGERAGLGGLAVARRPADRAPRAPAASSPSRRSTSPSWPWRSPRSSGLSAEERDEACRAAQLHEVGKIAIPDAILNKPGPLEDSEWEFIRRHPLVGERIIASAAALVPVARLVRSVGERWDGSGYPDGLAGEQIPLGSRVDRGLRGLRRDGHRAAALGRDEAGAGTRRAAARRGQPVRPRRGRGVRAGRRGAGSADAGLIRRPRLRTPRARAPSRPPADRVVVAAPPQGIHTAPSKNLSEAADPARRAAAPREAGVPAVGRDLPVPLRGCGRPLPPSGRCCGRPRPRCRRWSRRRRW